jgi:hypothetical protein
MSHEDDNYAEHLRRAKEDKIFNNRYNTGDGLSDSEEYQYGSSISVSSDYSDSYLKDIYDYEESLDSKAILDNIFDEFNSNPEIQSIISSANSTDTRIKFTKEEVNNIFKIIDSKLIKKEEDSLFYNPIYVLEVISNVSLIEYRKIFDMLDTEIQERLLIELNEKYKFLDTGTHKKRIH